MNLTYCFPSPLTVPFDENQLQNPASRKGRVRKKTTDLLLQACNSGRIKAVIGRSADFYGPGAVNSSLYSSFLQRMLDGKAPMFIGMGGVKHTYAYTGDVGKALVCLALDEACCGQVWHLPVSEPLTIEEITAKVNKILGSKGIDCLSISESIQTVGLAGFSKSL